MDKPRSSRRRRLVAAVGGGLLLLAGLAAAPAPAGSPPRAPDDGYPLNGHIDVVVPESDATDPARSVVTGTDEEGDLEVYEIERRG